MYILENIKKTYKSKKSSDTVALNNINLKLHNKGLVFIVGDSGSGKSTLLNVLGALDSIDDGKVIFNGKDISKFNEKEMDSYRNTCIGFVFQDYNVLEQYNVRDNIALSKKLQGEKVDESTVTTMLKNLGLDNLSDRKINELSGGQKQRVAIGRALIKDSKVILADEPTGNLDSESSNQIFQLLKNISNDRLVIVVSHNLDAAKLYGDRVITLRDGEIIEDTNNDEFVEQLEEIKYNSFKLNFKDAIHLCKANISRKKGRTFLTILLSSFAILFMIFTFNIYVFNEANYKYKFMKDNNESNVNIYNQECKKEDYNELFCNRKKLTDENIEVILNDISSPYGFIYYLNHHGETLSFDYGKLEFMEGYYHEKNTLFIDYKDKDLFTELLGREPSSINEVVVSEGIADRILFSGVYLSDGTFYKPTSFDELLNSNNTYKLGPINIKIVGISLVNDDEFNDAKKTNKLTYELELYIRQSDQSYNDYIFTKGFVEEIELGFTNEELLKNFNFINNYFMANDIKILDQEIIYYNFYGEQVTSSLNYDEIIVSIDSIRSNEGFDKNLSDYMKQNPHFSYNDALVSYTRELLVGNEVYNNRSYEYFLDNELIPEYKFDKIKVVGFVPGSVSYISDDLINKLDSPTKNRLGMYVNANDDDLKYVLKNYELIDYGTKLGENLAVSFKDMSDVYTIINLYDFIHVYVAGIACIFIVFMVLLTYNFILTTITVSKKDIGILRALGARNKDIFKIFVSESMVVTLLSYFGGLMLFFVSLVIINNIFLVNPFNELDVIKIEFISLLFSLLFSIIMSFLLSILSINRVSLIKPIDAILDK